MTTSNSHWLVLILVFSDIRKTQNNHFTYSPAMLNEKEWFGEYMKSEIENVIQNDTTTTIIVNCIVRFNADGETEKVVELLKRTGMNSLTKIEEFRGENITTFKDLDAVFKTVNAGFSSTRRLVLTYGHGTAFGIFSQSSNPQGLANPQLVSAAWKIKTHKFFESLYGFIPPAQTEAVNRDTDESYLGFIQDRIKMSEIIHDKNNFLSNEELSTAIRNNFGSIDLIIMNNCLMQNVYSQFAFQDVCDFLIAPQTGITFPGFNIQTIYSSLDENTNNRAITEKILHSFTEINEPVYSNYCIVGFQLTAYNKITRLLVDIKSYVFNKLNAEPDYYHNIKNAFNNNFGCIPFDESISHGRSFFDILQLISELCKFDTSLELTSHFQNLSAHLKENNICLFYKGGTFHKVPQNTGIKSYNTENLSGLTIYFPIRTAAINPILEKVFKNPDYENGFENSVKWEDILLAYKPLKGYKPRQQTGLENHQLPFIWINAPA